MWQPAACPEAVPVVRGWVLGVIRTFADTFPGVLSEACRPFWRSDNRLPVVSPVGIRGGQLQGSL